MTIARTSRRHKLSLGGLPAVRARGRSRRPPTRPPTGSPPCWSSWPAAPWSPTRPSSAPCQPAAPTTHRRPTCRAGSSARRSTGRDGDRAAAAPSVPSVAVEGGQLTIAPAELASRPARPVRLRRGGRPARRLRHHRAGRAAGPGRSRSDPRPAGPPRRQRRRRGRRLRRGAQLPVRRGGGAGPARRAGRRSAGARWSGSSTRWPRPARTCGRRCCPGCSARWPATRSRGNDDLALYETGSVFFAAAAARRRTASGGRRSGRPRTSSPRWTPRWPSSRGTCAVGADRAAGGRPAGRAGRAGRLAARRGLRRDGRARAGRRR